MLLSPYHAGGQRPPAQVLRNSLPGHSRLAAISASWLVSSKVAPPEARVPSKGSLALILPTSWAPSAHKATDGHAFRSAHVPRALCSTDISCKQNGVKNGTFLHQILDSANTPSIRQNMLCKPKRRKSCTHANKAIDIREEILDLITSTSRSARESELRPRIAKHLSGRVRPPGRIHVLYFAHL